MPSLSSSIIALLVILIAFALSSWSLPAPTVATEPFHTQLASFAREGDMPKINEFLVNHPNVDHQSVVPGVIETAMKSGHLHVAKELLPKLQQVDEKTLTTVLEAATRNGDLELLTLLLQKRQNLQPETWNEVIQDAVFYRQLETMKLLLTKYNGKLSDRTLEGVLELAASKGDTELLKELLSKHEEQLSDKTLIGVLKVAARNGDLELLTLLLQKRQNLQPETWNEVIKTANMNNQKEAVKFLETRNLIRLFSIYAEKGDLDLVKQLFNKYPDSNFDPRDVLELISKSMKAQNGMELTKFLTEKFFGKTEFALVYAIKYDDIAVAHHLMPFLDTSNNELLVPLLYAVKSKTSTSDDLPIKVLSFFFETANVPPKDTDDLLYQLAMLREKSAFDWIIENRKDKASKEFDPMYALEIAIDGSDRNINPFPDYDGIMESIYKLTGLDVKFPNIEFRFRRGLEVVLSNVDQEKPLKAFHNLVMELPNAAPVLLPTNQLGIRKTFVKYAKSEAIDAGGVTKDFISNSLNRLLTVDAKKLPDGDYPVNYALVKVNDEFSSLNLNNIFIDNAQMENEHNQELLHNFEFAGRSMGYALNKNLPSASLDFQESLLDAILEREMNVKTVVKDNEFLLTKLKTIVSKDLFHYNENPEQVAVSFDQKSIANGKETYASVYVTEDGELTTSENGNLLKYDASTQPEPEHTASDDIDTLLGKLSEHNRQVFLKEVKTVYDKLYKPQLDHIRKGLLSVIDKWALRHFVAYNSLKEALAGKSGKLTELGWQERTTLELDFSDGKVTAKNKKQAENMEKWFWEYMNAQDSKKQEEWYKFISGQSRFHPNDKHVMTLKILSSEGKSESGVTQCRAGAHTCANTFDLSIVDTKEELFDVLERTFVEAKGDMTSA